MATHIAMWSGPRNISTAMLRSFGNRADTFATDEPLYAHYLLKTGTPHPMRDEVIASQENDWRRVVAWITGPVPDGHRVWYQKHMAHHMLPEMWGDWIGNLHHAFLIREPRAMLASLHAKFPMPSLTDTGLAQQVQLFRAERERTGVTPPVIDARDVLTDPRSTLSALCDSLGIPFDKAMLSWPPGRRSTDGVWARHWYDAVERSTGFEAHEEREVVLPEQLNGLLAQCEELYAELSADRIT